MPKNEKSFIKNTPSYILLILFLLTCVLLSIIIAVTIGSTTIPFIDVYKVIINNIGLAFSDFGYIANADYTQGPINDIVMYIRLPRIILAIAVGMGLSVCGVIMQAIVKNPIADPYVLGVSSGASLGATLAIMLGIGTFLGANSIGIMAFVGAFSISVLVLMISNIGSRSNSVKLLLSGMALSSVCSAFSSFIVYFANDKDGMMTITYWLMGSLAGADWSTIGIILPIVIICSLFFITQYRTLNLMLLGDEVSVTLGTDTRKYRNIYLLVSAFMVGFLVYASGMIGFVGLIVPHFARMVVGTNHKKLIPISALLGALLLIWADVLSRVIIPQNELPIGILISMIGAPCFIYLIAKKSYGFSNTF